MPPAAIPILGKSAGFTQPYSTLGGGQAFVSSGPCSGTAWTHHQDLTIFYEVVTFPQVTGAWLPASTETSALRITVYGNAETALNFFSTSAVTGTSACATAAEARQAHILAVSSTTAAVGAGMGNAGSIYTLSAGYERRWTHAGDATAKDGRVYVNGLFEIAGLPSGWRTNEILSNRVATAIIQRVCNGGIQHQNDGVSPPEVSTDWPLLDYSLIDI